LGGEEMDQRFVKKKERRGNNEGNAGGDGGKGRKRD